jgi:hypothetical protein
MEDTVSDMILMRRMLTAMPVKPRTVTVKSCPQALDESDLGEADVDGAWAIKARVQLQDCAPEAALQTASQALRALLKKPHADDDTISELRLIVGLCQLECGLVDRAVAGLGLVAGWVTIEGTHKQRVVLPSDVYGLGIDKKLNTSGRDGINHPFHLIQVKIDNLPFPIQLLQLCIILSSIFLSHE